MFIKPLHDVEDFERAYRDHAPAAFLAARRVLRDDAASEDVVQDVFLGLWRRPDSFDPQRGSLGAFITMLAHSRALDRYRTRGVAHAAVQRLAKDIEDRPAPGALEALLRREAVAGVLGALDSLPRPQRQAVVASAHGLTCRELAEQAAIPIGTAKSRIRLGRLHARELVGDAA